MRLRTIQMAIMLACTLMMQAQISKVNVTIDGPGVVDEYLSLDADGKKQLKLKAVPSKFLGNVIFDGWSGDATGTSEELIVSPDKAQNIHAKFTYHRPTKKYPLVNLKQSWAQMGKPMYYEMPTIWETQDITVWRGTNYLPVDYNRDGYIDYVQFPKKGGMGTDNHRENVRFWLGKSDGSFEEDSKNDNRMEGTVYSIVMKYADFNDDGYPDFCSFSSGYDRNGSTGDYPVILMSDENCVYHDLRYPEYREPFNTIYGNYHGGTTGDFDNDGDIDILFWNQSDGWGRTSLYLENDGKGNFTKKKGSDLIDFTSFYSTLPDQLPPLYLDCEVIDLNSDGFNDLVMCGHDHDMSDKTLERGYVCPPIVLWGNSTGKFGSDYSLLPIPRLGYGISTSLTFYDFNNDGWKEIIVDKDGDGLFGNSRFYIGGYLQVCEWENGQYVDKTTKYIPVEHQAFNREASEVRTWIENIDGTDYFMAAGIEHLHPDLGTGVFKIYAIRNGVMESIEAPLQTKISLFDKGFPLYVDGHMLTDCRTNNDGVNPVDTMAEHSWAGVSDWDATTGNMWRIDFAHRKDTHFGRTCIRWNRDGQDPKKELEMQGIEFTFFSEVDLQSLAKEGYYLEFYIKNTDPDLTFNIGLETYDGNYTPESIHGYYATISSKHVEGGKFTGEWQRVLYPLAGMNGNEGLKIRTIVMRVDKGDLSNEFYLDDIRIRRLADSGLDDYDRAFLMDYLPSSYYQKERTAQVGSQEFKAMLKPLISKFAPDSMNYFNKYITDYEVPLTRGMAACMAYYTARSIGAETNNAAVGEQPEDIWDGDINNYDDLLPHWQDPGEKDAPADMFWRGTVFGGRMTCWYWNFWHVSDKSGINVIGLDKEANSFHWNNPLTWEDAIRAITRLYDSLDPELVASMQEDPVTITAKSYEIIYGEDLPTFEYTSEGTELDGTPSITCEATKNSPVGTYPIVITKGSVKNYNDTYVNGTLTIKKALLIVIPKDYNIKQGDELPTFEVTYEGFRNDETSAVLTKQPTTTTTATSTNEPDVYEINASGAEAQNYDISYSKGKLTIEAVEITPITETEEISFREQITADADLENVVIDNIYYNVKSANGDGYNATEQALVLNSTTTSEQMTAIQNAEVGDAAVRENYSGVIFEIPAGQGTITVDVKTIGTHVLNVQIGNNTPTKVTKSERGTVDVSYDVSEPTYVYLYASTSGGNAARLNRAGTAGANSVLLYGYKVTIGGTGINAIRMEAENGKVFELNGRQVKKPGKGVYIINGRKVVVK